MRNFRLLQALSGILPRKTFKAHSQILFLVSRLQLKIMALRNLGSASLRTRRVISRSYPFHNLRARKLAERDFRLERSRFETAGDRLCPKTDRVQDSREVLQWRVDLYRTDQRYD